MKRIRALIFDLGGVLTCPQNKSRVLEMMELLGIGGPVEEFHAAYSRHRVAYDRGTTGMEDYWRAVGAEYGVRLDDDRAALIPRLKELDILGWFEMRDDMLGYLEEARTMVRRMGLLSNINAECLSYLRGAFPWPGIFDHRTYSCEHGLMKPEAAIYELCRSGLGVESAECLFIDDVQANVEGAQRVGMNGIRFTGLADLRSGIEAEYLLSN